MCKRKLLLITNGFPFGDSERGFLSTEYQYLQESFEVYVLARIPQPPQAQCKKLDSDRVSCTGISTMHPIQVLAQVRRRYVRTELARACRKCGTKQMIMRASAVLRYSGRADTFQNTIETLCREKGIDLIYTFWCTQATLAALRVKEKMPHLRVVVRFHGYDLYNERTEENWQPFRHEIAQKSDMLIFVSLAGKEYFLSQWGKKFENKAVVSYLGCRDMKPVPLWEGVELKIVSCSNLIPLKRVEYIIEALAALPKEKKVVWHHFGDGTERWALEAKAREAFHEKKNIYWKFRGSVPNSKLDGLYRELGVQLFITTSSTEGGVPVTIQEAFAMGIPVIATAVGGIPELVVDGCTGYLLPENPAVSRITEAILKFAALSSEEKRRMSGNARKMWQEKCVAEKNACRFTQMLKCLLSERK